MTSMEIYHRVSAREMTPEEGADLLMKARERKPPNKPEWMPYWGYVVLVFLVHVLLWPILPAREQHRSG